MRTSSSPDDDHLLDRYCLILHSADAETFFINAPNGDRDIPNLEFLNFFRISNLLESLAVAFASVIGVSGSCQATCDSLSRHQRKWEVLYQNWSRKPSSLLRHSQSKFDFKFLKKGRPRTGRNSVTFCAAMRRRLMVCSSDKWFFAPIWGVWVRSRINGPPKKFHIWGHNY